MTWGKPEETRLRLPRRDRHRQRTHPTPRMTAIARSASSGASADPKRNWDTRIASWCIISPVKGSHNDHVFSLQWHRGVAGGPRVRAGCRYKTLPQAWKYIKQKRRSYYSNKYAQAENIIRLLLLKAQDAGLPGVKGLKFDSSLARK
jgi:hypothetical protein